MVFATLYSVVCNGSQHMCIYDIVILCVAARLVGIARVNVLCACACACCCVVGAAHDGSSTVHVSADDSECVEHSGRYHIS